MDEPRVLVAHPDEAHRARLAELLSAHATVVYDLTVDELALAVVSADDGGLALAARMRASAETSDVPIVFVAASPLDRAREIELHELGGTCILTEPVEPRILDSQVRTFLRLHHHRRALAEARGRLRAVMDAAPIGIAFSEDIHCRNVTGNATLLAQFGAEPGENFSASAESPGAIGRKIHYYQEGHELSDAQLPLQRAVIEGRTIGPSKIDVELPNGRRWIAQITGAPIRDEQGRVTGSVAVVSDISLRERLEAELRASEGRFRQTFENAAVGIAQLSPEGRWIRLNRAFLRIVGYTEDELRARSFADITHPDDVARDWAEARRLLSGEIDTYSLDKRYVRKDGSIVWVELTGSISVEPATGESHYIAVVVDISGRIEAERALRASEQRFRAMAESMPQLVWTADEDGIVDYYSARVSEFSGIEQAVDGTWSWRPVVHPDDLARTAEGWETAVRTGTRYECEHRIHMHNGEYRWHVSRANPVRDESTGKVRWFGTATDIHDRKVVESRLAAALEAAERAVRGRDQLVSMVSHDLRSPLNVIRLQTNRARRKLPDLEQLDDCLSRVERQVARMDRLIDELLDVARLQNGSTLALETRELDLLALVSDVVEEHRRETKNHRIEIHATVDGLVGTWDPRRIERVLENLLSNAIKYSPNGGVVSIELEREGELAVLRVRDQGVGIADSDRARIFEWFARGANVHRISGTGIGLAGARQIVEQHGGTVSVDSEVGRGSVFTVRLPLR